MSSRCSCWIPSVWLHGATFHSNCARSSIHFLATKKSRLIDIFIRPRTSEGLKPFFLSSATEGKYFLIDLLWREGLKTRIDLIYRVTQTAHFIRLVWLITRKFNQIPLTQYWSEQCYPKKKAKKFCVANKKKQEKLSCLRTEAVHDKLDEKLITNEATPCQDEFEWIYVILKITQIVCKLQAVRGVGVR